MSTNTKGWVWPRRESRPICSAFGYLLVMCIPILTILELSGCAGLIDVASSSNPSAPSPLSITNVQVLSATTSTCQITWTTNVAADSSVDYGTTANYGSNAAVDPNMVVNHSVAISGLAPNATYYYQVRSTDSKGNRGQSGGHTFKTSGLSISGTISPAPGGNGATVALSGTANATTTADSSGNYVFAGLSNGTYAVASSHAGYTFTPGSQTVVLNGSNATGINFVDSAQTFGISGTITPTAGGSGALLTLSGTASGTTTANASGAYMFTGLAGGAYTITPRNSGYVFSPASQNVSVNTANVTGVNFTDSSTGVAPTITAQPASQTVTAGQTATFTVVATGTAPLSYQWQKNGVNISGATAASYTTPATTTSDNGATFAAVVSNTAGSVTSNVATLAVNPAPVAPTITTQPASQTVTAGQTATFSVVATGTAPLGYQWYRNGAVISGALSSSYTTGATTSSDNRAQFTVVVSNTVGSVTSSAATLTVNAAPVAPSITTQPASQSVVAGQTATFSVVATGTAPLGYQWYRNGAVISAALSSSYTMGATTSSDNGAQFTVVVSNTAGSVTSSVATLTVNAAPVAPSITTQPTGQTVTAGQTATFSVVATGTAPLGYQWYRNGAVIPGATSSSYTMGTTVSSDNGAQFTVVVSNTAGSLTSSAATLTVNAAPVAPSITTQPASQTVVAGQTATFSVVVTGTAPLGYQWYRNGAVISAALSSSYTTGATTSSDNGAQFTVVVSNTAGSVTSSVATLAVNSPQISVVPSTVNFGSVVTGTTNTQTITLTNSGSANLTVSQASVSGSGFSTSGLTLPLTLTPGQSANFNIAFAPATVGGASGSVSLVSNTPTSPTRIAVTGSGVAATFLLGANPTSLSFGNVSVGSSASLSATLTNNGNSNITISSVTVSGSGFSASGVSSGIVLTPNQAVTLNATYSPIGAGNVAGSISVGSNATNAPTNIALSGYAHWVDLSWTASASVVVGYNVYRGTQSGGPYTKLDSTPMPPTIYTDSTVVSGLTYFYVVTAADANNIESLYSNEISATIP